MAEKDDQDQDDKTEEPSHRRLEEAKKEGRVPFSKEIVNWAFLMACGAIFLWVLPMVAKNISQSLVFFLDSPHLLNTQAAGLNMLSGYLLKEIAPVVAIPFILLILIIMISSIGQLRDSIRFKTLKPKINRLSISQGIKKIFSKKAVVEFLKTIIKTTILFIIFYLVFKDVVHDIKSWSLLSLRATFSISESLIMKLFIILIILLFFLAAADYGYQRREFMKSLRMTKQELKDEYKEVEGDPIIKQRIRKLRMDRARNKMMQKVPTATVIVTNPTHYSVALFFDEETLAAPRVVAKGQDYIALLIREIAKKNNVPIVENPAVARDLYARVELDHEIPEDSYKAVAEIIRFVMKLKKKPF